MLTKSDKQFIVDAIKDNNKLIFKEMIELFNATNERIDQSNKRIDQSNVRIDKVLSQLKDHNDILNNHERRIEKVEEQIFTTTTSS